MTNIVEYSSKSTALRGIARLGMSDKAAAEALITKTPEGKFAVDTVAVERALGIADLSEQDQEFVLVHGFHTCPNCDTHLSNGVCDFDGLVDVHGSEAAAYKLQKHEWSCMACGHEWGKEIEAPKGKGRKEPTRHYTNRSTVEGAVSVCWDLYDSMPDARRKDAIVAAVEKGVAFYTARTQYQKWFKAKKGVATR